MNNKIIFHLDLDAFFAAVEEIKKPSYKNKPLIIGGRTHNSVVSTCNYVARKYGIKSAMPIFQAKILCPQAIILNGDYALYNSYSKKIFTFIKEKFTNVCEQHSIDECFLDVTDIVKKYKDVLTLAKTIQKTIFNNFKLTVSIGISYNKFLAKMATDLNKPNGITLVSKNNFKDKIWPLSIEKMYFIGKSTAKILQKIGIKTIKDLAQFNNLKLLEHKLGSHWYFIHQNANGIGSDFVNLQLSNPKSLSVSYTLLNKTNDLNELENWLKILCLELSEKLKSHRMYCFNVILKFKYSIDKFYNKNIKLSEPIGSYEEIYKNAYILLNKIFNYQKSFRLLGIGAGDLIKVDSFYQQLTIFSQAIKPLKKDNLIKNIINDVNKKMGKDLINFATKLIKR